MIQKITQAYFASFFFILIYLLPWFSIPASYQQPAFHLLKIKIADTEIIEDLDADSTAMKLVDRIRGFNFRFVSNIGPGFLWAIVNSDDLIYLNDQGLQFQQIMKGEEIELHRRIVWGKDMVLPPGYHTYDEILAQLQDWNLRYPQIMKIISIGKTQQHQRNIYAFKISDNADMNEEEPRVHFSGAIHGHEIMGTEICMALIQQLVEKYQQDEKISNYVNSLEIWFIPVINVDGYQSATHIDPLWRKNARDNDGDGKLSPADGVDLNRNFDYNWKTSGSNNPSSKYYRGTAPFSESETKALAQFVKEQKFVFSITYHSAEARVYYPWRDGEPGNYKFAPQDDLLTNIANNIADRIKCINESYVYQAVRNVRHECYTTNYYYSALGTIDFMVEVGKYDYVYPQPILNKIIEHNLDGAYYLLDRTMGPGLTGKVTNAETGQPIEAGIHLLEYDNSEIQPRKTDPKTGRFYRALEQGSYQILITAEGMQSQKFLKVIVAPEGWSVLNTSLTKLKNYKLLSHFGFDSMFYLNPIITQFRHEMFVSIIAKNLLRELNAFFWN